MDLRLPLTIFLYAPFAAELLHCASLDRAISGGTGCNAQFLNYGALEVEHDEEGGFGVAGPIRRACR